VLNFSTFCGGLVNILFLEHLLATEMIMNQWRSSHQRLTPLVVSNQGPDHGGATKPI
jgi:hypothetical protein